MPGIQLLAQIEDLRRSKFGQPSPRHGLELLFWFAKDYIYFDNNDQIGLNYNPQFKEFGFHYFQNRVDDIVEGRLLPRHNPYYEVGNLHSPGAEELPDYVRKKYTGRLDNSNTDRLIIGIKYGKLDKVYVTQHENETDFLHEGTYEVSKGLLQDIHNISSCRAFLRQVHRQIAARKHESPPVRDDVRIPIQHGSSPVRDDVRIYMPTEIRSQRKTEKCCPCTIL